MGYVCPSNLKLLPINFLYVKKVGIIQQIMSVYFSTIDSGVLLKEYRICNIFLIHNSII